MQKKEQKQISKDLSCFLIAMTLQAYICLNIGFSHYYWIIYTRNAGDFKKAMKTEITADGLMAHKKLCVSK